MIKKVLNEIPFFRPTTAVAIIFAFINAIGTSWVCYPIWLLWSCLSITFAIELYWLIYSVYNKKYVTAAIVLAIVLITIWYGLLGTDANTLRIKMYYGVATRAS